MKRLLLVAVLGGIQAACSTYVPEPPSRLNPAGTIEAVKAAVRQRDYEAEWDALSPAFKERINGRVGRVVDVSDYVREREALASEPDVRQAEQLLQLAETRVVVMHSPTDATARLTGPMGAGGSAEIGMARHDRWTLRVADDPQPYDGFVGDLSIQAIPEPDGGYTVVMRDSAGNETMRQRFTAEEVERYDVRSLWFLDDLGVIEDQLFADESPRP